MAVARIVVYGREGATGFAYPRGGCIAADMLHQGTTENSEGERKNSFGAHQAKMSDWVSEAKRRNARERGNNW